MTATSPETLAAVNTTEEAAEKPLYLRLLLSCDELAERLVNSSNSPAGLSRKAWLMVMLNHWVESGHADELIENLLEAAAVLRTE